MCTPIYFVVGGVLTTVYSAGKGALTQYGVYWYPVRLLLLEKIVGETRLWRVKHWRRCEYMGSRPNEEFLIPEQRLIDELWGMRDEIRKIRVSSSHPDSNILINSTHLSSSVNGPVLLYSPRPKIY